MAVTFDNSGFVSADGSASATLSFTCAGSQIGLVVGVVATDLGVVPLVTPPTVTYGGVPLTISAAKNAIDPHQGLAQFYLIGATAGTANIVVTFTEAQSVFRVVATSGDGVGGVAAATTQQNLFDWAGTHSPIGVDLLNVTAGSMCVDIMETVLGDLGGGYPYAITSETTLTEQQNNPLPDGNTIAVMSSISFAHPASGSGYTFSDTVPAPIAIGCASIIELLAGTPPPPSGTGTGNDLWIWPPYSVKTPGRLPHQV